jgi:hypothetical protein
MTLRIEALENRWVPTTLTPTTCADGGLGSGSLRDAVLQFNADTGTDDDIIQLEAGTYALTIQNVGGRHETAGLTGDLNLTQTSHRWIIQGAGPTTIIDATQLQDRVFQIVNPATEVLFQDLVIQGGLAQDNGADGTLAGTTDALGGGILNNAGNLTLDNVVLQHNIARGGDGTTIPFHLDGYNAQGGSLCSTRGSVTISNSTIISNQAIGGSALSAANGGSGAGGGVDTMGGLIHFTNTMISGNAVHGGNGATGFGSYTSPAAGGNGGAGLGGGLYASGGMLTLTDATISSNTVCGGNGGDGGGSGHGGTGTPASSGGNGGAGLGGGLYASDGMLTLGNTTISTNTVCGGNGGNGGISFFSSSGDGGNGGASRGGGLYSGGTVSVSNSTVADNTIRGGLGGLSLRRNGGDGGMSQGGGLCVTAGATVQVSFSTIAINQATGGTHGTGYRNGSDGPATGGGVNNQGQLQTRDTLLAENTVDGPGSNSGPDLAGDLGSLGHNLVGDSEGGSGFDATDLLDVDALLAPLHDNGGPTQTMALLPGSPALNAGDPNQLGVPDQRGVVRSGGVNIGAYQASASAFDLDVPDTVQAGVPFDVTLTPVDPFGQVAVGYTGTVTFSTTDPDPGVVLPADYAFTLDDGGVHIFTDTGRGETTLLTPGDQMLTVTDKADGTITGSATVTVEPGDSPQPFGPGTTRATIPVQNVKSSSANIAVERFFATFGEQESTLTWLPQEYRKPGDPAGWVLDRWRAED